MTGESAPIECTACGKPVDKPRWIGGRPACRDCWPPPPPLSREETPMPEHGTANTTRVVITEGQRHPAAEATSDELAEAQASLDRALAAPVPHLGTSRRARSAAADRALDAMASRGLEAARTLDLVQQLGGSGGLTPDDPLDRDQRARASALTLVSDEHPTATVDELLDLTDYVVTGTYTGQAAR